MVLPEKFVFLNEVYRSFAEIATLNLERRARKIIDQRPKSITNPTA
jgi:hypothetical protein